MTSKYEIWASSQPFDGEFFNAFILGSQEADSFNEAVEKLISTLTTEQAKLWTKCLITDRWFFYGIEVFETEELAKQSFWQKLEGEMKEKS